MSPSAYAPSPQAFACPPKPVAAAIRRGAVRSLASAIALAALCIPSASAQAADPAAIAKSLQSRFWWVDLGSNGSRPFGYLYMFGTQSRPLANGWYTGQRVTFRGMIGAETRLGFAWKPTTTGVIIDHASSRETLRFIQFYADVEVLEVAGSFYRYMVTTISPYCPSQIRKYYYWKR